MVIKIPKKDIIINVSMTYHEKPLRGKKLYFKLKPHNQSDWKDEGEGITDKNGIIQKIFSLEEGEAYDLLIVFDGDDQFAPMTKRIDNIYVRPRPNIEVTIVEQEYL